MDCLAFLAREVQRGVAERVDSRRIRAAAEQVRRDVHVAVVRRVPAAVWRAWAVRTYRYRVGPLCHSCSERYVVGRCDILPAVQAPSPSAMAQGRNGVVWEQAVSYRSQAVDSHVRLDAQRFDRFRLTPIRLLRRAHCSGVDPFAVGASMSAPASTSRCTASTCPACTAAL